MQKMILLCTVNAKISNRMPQYCGWYAVGLIIRWICQVMELWASHRKHVKHILRHLGLVSRNTFSLSEKQCFNLDKWYWFVVFICQVYLSWEWVFNPKCNVVSPSPRRRHFAFKRSSPSNCWGKSCFYQAIPPWDIYDGNFIMEQHLSEISSYEVNRSLGLHGTYLYVMTVRSL